MARAPLRPEKILWERHADRCGAPFLPLHPPPSLPSAFERLPRRNDWHAAVHTQSKCSLCELLEVAACHWAGACYCKPSRVPLQTDARLKSLGSSHKITTISQIKRLYPCFEYINIPLGSFSDVCRKENIYDWIQLLELLLHPAPTAQITQNWPNLTTHAHRGAGANSSLQHFWRARCKVWSKHRAHSLLPSRARRSATPPLAPLCCLSPQGWLSSAWLTARGGVVQSAVGPAPNGWVLAAIGWGECGKECREGFTRTGSTRTVYK